MTDWHTILGCCGIILAAAALFFWPRIVAFIVWLIMPRGS